MKELICGLYLIIFTFITWPIRYKYSKATDRETIKEGQAKCYKMVQHLCKMVLKVSGVKLEVKGANNLDINQTAVYMGTHKSYLDIVVMISLIDTPLIFIGKEEVNKLPIIRTWFKAIGGIPMDRSDMRQSLKVILEAIEELKDGYSVAIFPEGTRSRNRQMLDFKAGSFKLATKANVPIVPIAMQDTFKVLEEKKRLKSAVIGVNIGEMIDVASLDKEDLKTLHTDTRDYMKELLDEVTITL